MFNSCSQFKYPQGDYIQPQHKAFIYFQALPNKGHQSNKNKAKTEKLK